MKRGETFYFWNGNAPLEGPTGATFDYDGGTMQKWEYMWIYVAQEKGQQVFIANGERVQAQTYAEALNAVGQEGWELVAVVPPTIIPTPTNTFAQLCLKRPIVD